MQPSALLALPGELHNRIYEFSVQDMSKSPIGLIEPDRALYWRKTSPANSNDWSNFKRTFLGLTQVCRQIRGEFLPLYETKFEAGIEIAELHAYLIDFVIKQMRHDSYAKVFVEFPGDFDVPIRDLILLCSKIPEHKLCLRTAFPMDQKSMDRLLFAQHNPKWLDCVLNRASRVHARTLTTCYSGSIGIIARLSVYFGPEYYESWMPLYRMEYANYNKHIIDWRRDCGLRKLGDLALPRRDKELYLLRSWMSGKVHNAVTNGNPC